MWNLMENKNIQKYISDKMKIKIKYHTVWIVLKYKYIVEKLKFATISVVLITDITQNITASGSHMDDFPIKAQVRNNYRYTEINI
jgi:hypothetical protein